MDEILSPEEIEALLGELPERSSGPSGAAGRMIQEYDLTRPTRMGHSQVDRVSQLHGAIAGPLGEKLGKMLDLSTQVDLAAVEQLRVDDFLKSLPERTPVYGLGDENVGVTGRVAADPTFLVGAIDRMLGGLGEAEPAPREMTPTELALTENLMAPLLAAISDAWAEVQPMHFRVLSKPGEPRPGEDLEGNAPVLGITFLVGGSGPTGSIRYCLATKNLEAQLSGESSQKLLNAPKPEGDPRVAKVLREVDLTLSCVLGHARVPLSELSEMSPGDVIPLERGIDQPLDVLCAGQVKFRGYAGHRRGRLAVSITERLQENDATTAVPAVVEG